MIEWTDSEGTRAALLDGYLTLYGKPGMTRGDGVVSLGVELPDDIAAAILTASEAGSGTEGRA